MSHRTYRMDNFGKPNKVKTGLKYLIVAIVIVVVGLAIGELILKST